jgi:hypothetical protein
MEILPLAAILIHADRLDEAFCDYANIPRNHLVSFATHKKPYKAKGRVYEVCAIFAFDVYEKQ